ncbi:MAG TPA: hypothetical protein PLM53_05790 [Spirochaetota bacterium]|nr:hypothetical protein [Spirochaetota bacterium]HPC42379.1 hypothetical protein [Spirochaetota bacterium]HPL16403.1 hypothetical protein [Spirochaetota bacterium]HQF08032.1 hypothetical protein [Spirochaetota bacterium]HQH96592.1 hypothetical protein [Spirochaetota bacterium]
MKTNQNKRLYGKSLIRKKPVDIVNRILIFCILVFPLMAAGANLTCLMQPRDVAVDPYWNDVARYLAGMEVREKSLLWEKTKEPRYSDHRRFMDGLWDKIQKSTIDIIEPWRDRNVPSAGSRATAFYPLSGADFINLHTLFPGSRRYLMIAMEPEGDASVLKDHQSRRLIDGLVPVERSIYLYGVNNYFQSKVMSQEMTNRLLPGTAPALLIFMARMGLVIKSVDNVFIGDSGDLVSIPGSPRKEKGKIYGIRILFTGRDGSARELVYLSMKIGPGSVDPSTPEGKYLGRLNGMKTMMKSAVYLLHHRPFDGVRDFILKRSIVMVQDDSGIPYRFFTRGWKVSLFGKYRPAMALKYCMPVSQPDLKEQYSAGVPPLPFNFGYGILFGPGQSNIMVAKKM